MNNIEILEEFIPLLEDGYVDNKDCTKEIQAIENLIQENKELKKQIPSPTNPIPIEYQTDIWVLKRDYIAKSKLKEKIETLEKLQNEFKNNEELRIKIIAYKELLEERK